MRELCSSNRWKKCCHRTSGFDSEFPWLPQDRRKHMLFACCRYQFPTCYPSHTLCNLYTEELHVEKHYKEKKVHPSAAIIGRQFLRNLGSAIGRSLIQMLRTTHCTAPQAAKRGGEQQGAGSCLPEVLRRAQDVQDGTRWHCEAQLLLLTNSRHSRWIWSCMVCPESPLFSSQSIRWKRFICNKLFHFRAPLPASAFSLYCRITQSNKVNYYALHSSSERSNTLFGKQMTEKFWIKYIWHASETEFITEKE